VSRPFFLVWPAQGLSLFRALKRWQQVSLVLLLALFAWRLAPKPQPPPTDNIPLVTVRAVTYQKTDVMVSATGSLVARHDMPIGVDGESGRIAAILVEAGDQVRQGQVLAKLDTAVLSPQVANLRAALEQYKAEAQLAQADYKRAAAIVSTVGALSKEELDKRQANMLTSEARVKAAQAQLAEADARLNRSEIKAPENGLVLMRNAEVGQAVTPGGSTLFRLAKDSEIEMKGLIAEQDLPQLREGQKAEVTITGVETPYVGTVRLVGVMIDPVSRQAEIRIALPKDRNLRPGAYARATVVVGQDDRPVLPQTALLTEGGNTYIYVVDEQSKAQQRKVTLAQARAGGITIASGLTGKESVVTVAGTFLHPGQPVHVHKE
jgi:HlyD family secretion protein